MDIVSRGARMAGLVLMAALCGAGFRATLSGAGLRAALSGAGLRAGGTVTVAVAVRAQTPERDVEAAVAGALERYSSALESLDAASVKKVQPSIDLESLKKAFRAMRSLEVTIADLKVLSTDATIVRVSCRVTQTLIPKAGSKQTTAVTRVVRLRKQDTAFVIDAFER